MKTVEDKTITIGQLKCMAELFTYAMREIDSDCAAVRIIDEFIEQIEGYVNSL